MFTNGLYNFGSYKNTSGLYDASALHQLHPASILVGIVRQGGSITVAGSTANHDDGWLYVDSVGSYVAPRSLHRFQRRLRGDPRLDFLRWKHRAGIPANAPDATLLPGKTQSILVDWATGGQSPTVERVANAAARFSIRVRTGDPLLHARLEMIGDLADLWNEIPADSLFIRPTQAQDFQLYEVEVPAEYPRAFFHGVFWRDEP